MPVCSEYSFDTIQEREKTKRRKKDRRMGKKEGHTETSKEKFAERKKNKKY
jgi:hypothetical protein